MIINMEIRKTLEREKEKLHVIPVYLRKKDNHWKCPQ